MWTREGKRREENVNSVKAWWWVIMIIWTNQFGANMAVSCTLTRHANMHSRWIELTDCDNILQADRVQSSQLTCNRLVHFVHWHQFSCSSSTGRALAFLLPAAIQLFAGGTSSRGIVISLENWFDVLIVFHGADQLAAGGLWLRLDEKEIVWETISLVWMHVKAEKTKKK